MTYASELEAALSFYGLTEVDGPASDPALLTLIQKYIAWADDDSTVAWCAVFMTHLARITGHDEPSGKQFMARSWLTCGKTVADYNDPGGIDWNQVRTGDRVILSRGNPAGWQGHVALYVNEYDPDPAKIRLLGGNQSNGVLIRAYPKDRVLGIRRAVKNIGGVSE